MGYFPIFVDIEDKLIVVVGAGKVAERKVLSLLQFGARIKVISPEFSQGIKVLHQEKKIEILQKEFEKEDLKGAFMVIGATCIRAVNNIVSKEAMSLGIYSNIADSLEESSFIFPSTIKNEDVVIGISTSGSCPILSSCIREMIEDVLPTNLDSITKEMKEYRRELLKKNASADENAKGTKAEDTKAEGTKAEDTKAEGTKAEDTKYLLQKKFKELMELLETNKEKGFYEKKN